MKKMKNFAILGMTMLVALFTSCGTSSTASKQVGLTIPEGDRATVTYSEDGKYMTITFPEDLTNADDAIYASDLVGYLLKCSKDISTDGRDFDGKGIYYYMHNSREWLHKGQYDDPTKMDMKKLKSITMSTKYLRLRDFADLMPLMTGDKEKKNDSGFQDEISFGNTYYYYMEVVVKDTNDQYRSQQ